MGTAEAPHLPRGERTRGGRTHGCIPQPRGAEQAGAVRARNTSKQARQAQLSASTSGRGQKHRHTNSERRRASVRVCVRVCARACGRAAQPRLALLRQRSEQSAERASVLGARGARARCCRRRPAAPGSAHMRRELHKLLQVHRAGGAARRRRRRRHRQPAAPGVRPAHSRNRCSKTRTASASARRTHAALQRVHAPAAASGSLSAR